MPSKTTLLLAAALTLATSVTADANRPRMYYPQRAKRNVDTQVDATADSDEMKRDLWSDLMEKFKNDQEDNDSGVTTITVEQTIWVPPPGGTGTASVQPISEPQPTTSSTQSSRSVTSSTSRSGTLVGPGGIIFPSPSSTTSDPSSTATDSQTTTTTTSSQTTVPASVSSSSTSSTGGLLDPIISGLLPNPSSSNTTSAASETGSSGVKSTTDSQTTTSTTTSPSPTGTGLIPIVTSALSSILDPTTSANATSTDTSTTVPPTDTSATPTGTDTTTPPTTTPTLTPTDGTGNTTSTDTTTLPPTSTPTVITTSGNATETQTTSTTTSTDLPTTVVTTTTSSNGTVTGSSSTLTSIPTETTTTTLAEPTTTETGVTSITPTASTGTGNWLPTTIIAATSTFTWTAPTASESAATSTALPTNIPKVIVPAEGDQPPPKGSVGIQIGFKYPLNYDFVVGNNAAAGQIFQYLPIALAEAAGIPVDNVQISKLVPFDTRNTNGFITTLAKLNYPQSLVDSLKASMWAPNSKLYNNPLQIVNNLTSLINPTIDLLGNNDDEGVKKTGSGGNGNDAVGSGGSQSSQSSKQMGATAAIVLGSVSFAGLYGAAMFILARRYKRKRQSHRRTSSLSSAGHSAEMQFAANGSPALMTGALISPNNNRGTYGGQSQNSVGSSARTAGISAPVAAENSLGWN